MLLISGGRELRRLTARLCLIELVAWGVLYYSFAVYLAAMQDELGWSSATFAGGFSLALLVAGLAAPIVGRWIDRHGGRRLMVAGALAGGVGVAVWSIAHSPPVYFAGWILIGAGMAGTLYTPAFATIVRSHPGESRHAILVVTLIGALASTLFMPLASGLGESLGWRGGLLVLAAVMVAVITPLALGLPAPAADKAVNTAAPGPSGEVPGRFRLLASSLMIADAAGVAVQAYLVLFLVERGLPLAAAAGIAGLAGAAKIAGRLATAAGHRISALAVMRLSLLLTAAVLLLPLLQAGTAAAIAMVLGIGATTGARTILRPLVVLELFGRRDFGRSSGLLQLCTALTKAAGPIAFGLLLTALGWSWAWSLLALLLVASAAAMHGLRPTPEPMLEPRGALAPGDLSP